MSPTTAKRFNEQKALMVVSRSCAWKAFKSCGRGSHSFQLSLLNPYNGSYVPQFSCRMQALV